MSVQGTPSKIPAPGGSAPKGPLKATVPIPSVFKQSAPTRSPTNSYRRGPLEESLSGQRSPGSVVYKGKTKSALSPSECNSIRRTASLDAIYLKGHWPRDLFYWHAGTLQIDKATQTEESDLLELRKIHCISETEENKDKLIVRQKMRSTKESHIRHVSPSETLDTSSQTLSSCILSPTLKANPVTIPKPSLSKPSIRSSVEGLNQEIERLVLRDSSACSMSWRRDDRYLRQVTPEGHRAPLAEMFKSATRSKSVNTQTPQEFGSCSRSSAESEGSSPDQETSKLGSSPQINKFLAREPPDGCERIRSKTFEDRRPAYSPVDAQLLLQTERPQPCTFKLKPSLGSAFQILQPTAATAEVTDDLPLVPQRSQME